MAAYFHASAVTGAAMTERRCKRKRMNATCYRRWAGKMGNGMRSDERERLLARNCTMVSGPDVMTMPP